MIARVSKKKCLFHNEILLAFGQIFWCVELNFLCV